METLSSEAVYIPKVIVFHERVFISMNQRLCSLALVVIILGNSACAATPTNPVLTTTAIQITPTMSRSGSCSPTRDDGVSPSYKPDTPERSVVGKGHVLTGVVLSAADCQPIVDAKLEFWPEEEGLGHPDTSRATFFTDQNGSYRFECNPPEHIHMRISAPGYRTIGVNSYHPEGRTEGVFDIVLSPE